MHLFIFGEEIQGLRDDFRSQLIAARGDAILEHLFQKTANSLRHFIATLSADERKAVPSFKSWDDLINRNDILLTHAGIENALLFTSGIASYLK